MQSMEELLHKKYSLESQLKKVSREIKRHPEYKESVRKGLPKFLYLLAVSYTFIFACIAGIFYLIISNNLNLDWIMACSIVCLILGLNTQIYAERYKNKNLSLIYGNKI